MRKHWMAAALAAVLLATAGCGGSGGSGGGGDYFKSMTSLGEGFATSLGDLTTQVSAAVDDTGRVTAMTNVKALLDKTEASVRKLDAPDEASANQKKLLGQFDTAEDQAQAFIDAAKKHDPAAVSSAASDFNDTANQIPSTFVDISLDKK